MVSITRCFELTCTGAPYLLAVLLAAKHALDTTKQRTCKTAASGAVRAL
jgi:hypothetical protein